MDRDKRWERVKEAYDLIVSGKGKQTADLVAAMQESYDEGTTDEFIKPIHNSNVDGLIGEGDVVIFINFRNDRAKELTIALTQEDLTEHGMKTIGGLQYYCMTPYDASFKGVNILFPKENVADTLGEYPRAADSSSCIQPRQRSMRTLPSSSTEDANSHTKAKTEYSWQARRWLPTT